MARRSPDEHSAEHVDLGDGAHLDYVARFVPEPERAFAELLEELVLDEETIVMFGREVPVPRLVGYYGDPGRPYRYSGRDHEPRPWPPRLAALRARLVALTGTPYDTVLANLYRDGGDAMGRHADDEPELGPARDDIRIASVSLGARRTFRLRHRTDGRRLDFELGGGDLLVMRGTTQSYWMHEVPRTARAVGPRLNLTFRCVTPRTVRAEPRRVP
ncbi:MAG: alpha-ketoglutarate-dependent dioxygenase AlkB [Planctomycetes bacterium]|nr:alpha-ketoglutarate-dependent dioxygenase AlkB [Planctomycetota bacterium]